MEEVKGNKTGNRGGKRVGAGRKYASGEEKRVQLAVRILPKLHEKLSQEPSKAAVLEKLLSEYYQI